MQVEVLAYAHESYSLAHLAAIETSDLGSVLSFVLAKIED
jgi:hypothetical protein